MSTYFEFPKESICTLARNSNFLVSISEKPLDILNYEFC